VTETPFKPVQFGRYKLLEKMAVGGMAEIFKAKSHGAHGFEKTLVVKRILPQLAEDPGFVDMFIDEAKVTVRINHPKVVQVLDFGEVEGQYFIAMEYVEGIDGLALLRMCVQQGFRPTTHIAVHIVAEVLDALHYAHTLRDESGGALDIVHRDISPSNIFISSQGEVKLGDFGIARASIRTAGTDTRNLKGKYGYLSPEVVTGGTVDQRSDIFSAGVVLAELLMVRRLFVAKSELEVLLQVRDARLDRLERFGKHIPDDLRTVLESALARDRNMRYQDAASFRDALHRYLYDHRRMIRHTDVRRFLRRLQGDQEESISYETMPSMPSKEGRVPKATPDGLPPPQRKPSPAVPGGKSPSRPKQATVPMKPTPHKPKPAVDPDAPETDEKPTRPGKSSPNNLAVPPAEEMPPGGRWPSLHTGDAPGSAELQAVPSARGKRPTALEQLAAADPFVPEDTPIIIGQKRKIRILPPPKPAPPEPLEAEEEVGMTSDAMMEALPEIKQGTDSKWEKISSKNLGEEVLPLTDMPFPTVTAEKVAAARVQTAAKPLSEGESEDMGGDLARQGLLGVIFRLAVQEETGLLVLHCAGVVKEIYLVNGDPRFVASNQADDLFGQHLMRKKVITDGELSMALAMLPHYKGKLGNALVALRLLTPVQVLRHLTQQVRENLLDAFGWAKGTYRYYRGTECEFESAPLGLNAFELIGAAVNDLPKEDLYKRLEHHKPNRYRSVNAPPVPPEVFRLGSRPRAVFDIMDGRSTLADFLSRFDDPTQEEVFARLIYLLVETGFTKKVEED